MPKWLKLSEDSKTTLGYAGLIISSVLLIVLTFVFFENDQLIRMISNQDCDAPFADDFLDKEGKQILNDFNSILTALK